MKIEHITTVKGPLTIATYDGMSARLPGFLGPQQVQNQLNINRAIDAQQRKHNVPSRSPDQSPRADR